MKRQTDIREYAVNRQISQRVDKYHISERKKKRQILMSGQTKRQEDSISKWTN